MLVWSAYKHKLLLFSLINTEMASFADDLFVLQGFGLSLSGVRALMLAALHDARNCGSAANMGRLE